MKLVLLSCLFSVSAVCSGQNLVPNPSFEDTLECPDFPGQVWRAEHWYVAASTPDYYNCCSNNTHPACGVPNNIFSFRYAPSGVAYCGIWTYARNNPPPDFQEKIGVEILTPLEVGTRYFISMKVSSVSSNKNEAVNGAHNKLGILLSTVKYDLTHPPPNANYAQFYCDSIITDTVGWVTIKGSFVADSAYKFLTIGNFFNSSHVDTVRYWYINGNNELTAYYYVDDVCLTTDSLGCDFSSIFPGDCSYSSVNPIADENTFEMMFPNPSTENFTLQFNFVKVNSVLLLNSMGEIIYSNYGPFLESNIKIDASELPSGIYFIQVQSGFQKQTRKIFKTLN